MTSSINLCLQRVCRDAALSVTADACLFVMQAVVRQRMFSAVPNTRLLIKILTTVLFSLTFQPTFGTQVAAGTAFILNICTQMTRYLSAL